MNEVQFALFMEHIRVATDARLASSRMAWMTEISIGNPAIDLDNIGHSIKCIGEPGSRLRELFNAHTNAMSAWNAAHSDI